MSAHAIAITVNMPVLDSERKKNRGRTTRHHRRSGENNFYNGLSRIPEGNLSIFPDMPDPVEEFPLTTLSALVPTEHTPEPTPEIRLHRAVLEDALLLIWQNPDTGKRETREEKREALRWLLSHDASWSFSFVGVCEVLRIDPDYLRKGILAKRKWGE